MFIFTCSATIVPAIKIMNILIWFIQPITRVVRVYNMDLIITIMYEKFSYLINFAVLAVGLVR